MKLETQLLSGQVTKLHTTRRHRTETQSAATFGEATSYKESCLLCCDWSRIKSNFLFTLPLTLPVYFEQITRCLSASLFRVGHSGQVSTVQHSGCFGRGVTSLIFRDVNISKQHPQLSTQLLVGLKRWLWGHRYPLIPRDPQLSVRCEMWWAKE